MSNEQFVGAGLWCTPLGQADLGVDTERGGRDATKDRLADWLGILLNGYAECRMNLGET